MPDLPLKVRKVSALMRRDLVAIRKLLRGSSYQFKELIVCVCEFMFGYEQTVSLKIAVFL